MRAKPGRRALLSGLMVSGTVHLLVLWLNPGLKLKLGQPPSEPNAAAGEPARLIAIRVTTSPVVVPIRARSATSSRSANVAAPVESAPLSDTGINDGVRARDTDVSASDRLRYRSSSIWMPPTPMLESEAECFERELAERIEKGIADKNYAKLPPRADGTFGVILRIPLGRKPPPPPQTVPAPLPDSLRRRTPRDDATRTTQPFDTIETVRRRAGCGNTIQILERAKNGRPPT